MIIAVDFDGTLVENCFPAIGEPLMGLTNKLLIDELIELQRRGDKIILWTCRVGKDLEAAVKFCKSKGLTFDAVNEDSEETKKWLYTKEYLDWQRKHPNVSHKIYADIYIDDRALTNRFLFNLNGYRNGLR